jgi:hypothetical protein
MATQSLTAQLNALHFRELRRSTLRVFALSSAPLWVQAHRLWIPGWLTWPALLVGGASLALVIAYAALGHRWKKLAESRSSTPRVAIHVARTAWDGVSAGLWSTLAGLSMVPWTSAVLANPLPAWLPRPLTLAAGLVMSVLVLVQMARRSSHRRDASAPGTAERAHT